MATRKGTRGSRQPARIAQQPVAQSRSAAAGYVELLEQLKERIRAAQGRAGLAVNRELIMLYRDLGNEIWKRQQGEGWGAKGDLPKELRGKLPTIEELEAELQPRKGADL